MNTGRPDVDAAAQVLYDRAAALYTTDTRQLVAAWDDLDPQARAPYVAQARTILAAADAHRPNAPRAAARLADDWSSTATWLADRAANTPDPALRVLLAREAETWAAAAEQVRAAFTTDTTGDTP